MKNILLSEFHKVFVELLEHELNNVGKTLSNSEKLIINEFIVQAKNNGYTKLLGGRMDKEVIFKCSGCNAMFQENCDAEDCCNKKSVMCYIVVADDWVEGV